MNCVNQINPKSVVIFSDKKPKKTSAKTFVTTLRGEKDNEELCFVIIAYLLVFAKRFRISGNSQENAITFVYVPQNIPGINHMK